jgi:hypothetical protein
MAHKYDEFYRNLCDAKVVVSTATREAERLGLSTTLDELKDCYGVLHKIANNVITKIEAEHVAGLLERREEKRRVNEQGYSVSPEQYGYSASVPFNPQTGQRANVTSVTLAPSAQATYSHCPGDDMLAHLRASGLNPIVIDEDTDFDKLPTLNHQHQKEKTDDSCPAPAEGHSAPAAADPAPPTPEADQGSCGGFDQ